MDRFGPDVTLDDPAFIHDSALIYGAVCVGRGASLWPYAVIRAEAFDVVIGAESNIQDFVMIHVGERCGAFIGERCTIAHRAIIHGARIGDDTLIGPGATLMDGAEVGSGCIIAGGSYLTAGQKIPDHSIALGAPARVLRKQDCRAPNRLNAQMYVLNAQAYARGEHRAWAGPGFPDYAAELLARIQAELGEEPRR